MKNLFFSTKLFLKQIIIISIFVAVAILFDFFSGFLFPFLTMYFGGKIFKISFLILFLSGFLFGFKIGFFVCFFYSFYHLINAFISFFLINNIFSLTTIDILLSCFLNYIFSDLVIIFSGFLAKKKYTHNYIKNILFIMLIISLLRMLFFFLSSYYIYAPMIDFSKIYYFWGFLETLSPKKQLFWFCFVYNFIPCFTNYIVSSFLIIFLTPKLKYIFDKYIENVSIFNSNEN